MNNYTDIITNFSGLLETNIFEISLSRFLIAISILLSVFFLKNIIKKIFLNYSLLFIKNIELRKNLSSSIERPFGFLILVLGFFFSTNILAINEKSSFLLDKINLSLFTIFFFWVLNQSIGPLVKKIKGVNVLLTKDLMEWFIAAIRFVLIILAFSAVLELWGIKVAPIIAGLGLFGVAIALGAQDLFKNLISGILVLVEKRFKKGDVISIENIVEGTVEKIGFRSTSIRKFDKSLCFIPNSQFAEKAVTNITEIPHRRINWVIGLEYKTKINQLKIICSDIEGFIIKNKAIFIVSDSTPVIVKVVEFADSSINIMIRCFTHKNDYNSFINSKNLLALELKGIVERRKCSFAFPSQSIYVEKNN